MINDPMAAHDSHCTTHPFKRVCWTAIFVGALVGVGLGFLLNLFGVAIGLSAVSVNQEGAVAMAIGGVIGIFIAVIVSMAVAGYAAGYLGRLCCPRRNLGILYGFITWSLALLLSAALAAPLSQYVSAYSHNIAGSVVMAPNSDKTVAVVKNAHSEDRSQHMTKVEASTGTLAWGAFLLFTLFLIGAISSCVGASCAMICRRED